MAEQARVTLLIPCFIGGGRHIEKKVFDSLEELKEYLKEELKCLKSQQ